MKILLIVIAMTLFSCHNSADKQVYKDSAIYFSNKLAEVTDSGYTQDDSVNMMRKGRAKIYEVMRQYYIDKSKE